MAIHFVTGRPGAGKGLYSMKLLLEEIRGTDRSIVSNLAVHPDLLAEYCHEEFGQSFDLLTRWQRIQDEDLTEFYCHRGPESEKLEVEYDAKGKAIAYEIDKAMQTKGVFYILDEVHLAFGARDWMNTGRACMHYASQHRKLGDDVILVTQAPKNVDNQFRSLAQDYTVVRNHGMEKFLFFKQPDVFTRQTFLNLPTGGMQDKPLEKGMFRMDLKVANCYDTSAGVGIHERGDADKGSDRRKGFNWKWVLIIFPILIFLLWKGPSTCAGGFQKFVGGANPRKTENNATKKIPIPDGPEKTAPKRGPSQAKPQPRPAPPPPKSDRNQTQLSTEPREQQPAPVENVIDDRLIIGYVNNRTGAFKMPILILNDGTSLEHGTGYESISADGAVLFDGTVIRLDRGSVDLRKIFSPR